MKKILTYLKIFARLCKANLQAEMEYKANFIAAFVCSVFWLALNVVFFQAVYGQTGLIGDWNKYQAVFFVAVFNVVDGVFFILFFRGIIGLEEAVRSGSYDYILLKPLPKLFLVCFRTIDVSRFVNLLFALLLFVWMLKYIGFHTLQFLLFLLMMFNGILLYAAMFLVINTLTFRFVNIYNIIVVFFDVMEFGRMPSVITQGLVRPLLMFALPVLFVAGIPCEYLFGQNNYLPVVLSSVVTILFVFAACVFFHLEARRYTGASS